MIQFDTKYWRITPGVEEVPKKPTKVACIA